MPTLQATDYERLRTYLRGLTPEERATKIRSMSPGLQSGYKAYLESQLQPQIQPKQKKSWLGSFANLPVIKQGMQALEWGQEQLVEPFAASVTAPFHEGPQAIWKPVATLAGTIGGGLVGGPVGAALGASATGTTIGHTGKTEESYEEWESPWGVKGVTELAYPAFLIPAAKAPQWLGRGAEALRATRTAAVAGKVAQQVARAEALPAEMLGKGIRKIRGKEIPVGVTEKVVPPAAPAVSKEPWQMADSPSLDKWAKDILRKIEELDAERAPDVAYRELLSTSTRRPLVKGESWRDRAKNLAEKSLAPSKARMPEALPGEIVSKGIRKVSGKPVIKPKIMGDLQDFDEMVRVNFTPDNATKIANLPGVKNIIGVVNPAALANDPVTQSIIGRQMLRHEGQQKAQGVISLLSQLGDQKKIFGKLTDEGLIAEGPLKGLSPNTVRTYRTKYAAVMTPEQNAWVDTAQMLEREKLDFLTRNGIEINELSFEEGGEYAGRRVYGMVNADGELLDTAFVGAGPGRPGAKLAAEKHRVFETPEEALKAGYRYLPDDEALYYNIMGAYNRVADKEMSEWLLEKIPWRTIETPEGAKIGAFVAKQKLNRAKQLQAGLNRAVRGERLPEATIKSIERNYPDEAQTLRDLVAKIQRKEQTGDMVQGLHQRAKILIKEAGIDYRNTVNLRKVAREKAIRPTYTEASLHDIPAFAGKIFTGADAKETARLLRKEFSPQFNKALTSVNKANAIARYFALAGDASVGTIQLLFLAGSKPTIYGKAMAGFVKAMMDPEYHARLLAKNNDLIQSSRNLILTKSGTTEFTEAMAKGGWMSSGKQLFPKGEAGAKTAALMAPRTIAKVGTKILTPFQRGFEASLDTAGIELRKSYGYLCTTPERTAQVEQFINEFRGLTSSARIGVGPTQRQLETIALLAPRYNRAIGGLLFDLSRGNLRGQLARESMAHGVAAIGAMAVAISIAKGETPEEITDHFNPTSPNFFTWDIAGQKVGPGSKVRSVVKLFADSIKNRDDLGKFSQENWMQNPIVRFGRGNASPVISTGLDIMTGRDYLGEPTRENMLQFSEHLFGENLVPIWAQSVAFEGGDLTGRAARGAGEFGGLRTYPQPLWEVRDDLRNRYSSQMYQGKSWSDLNDAERDAVLKANPDLIELDRKVKVEGLEKYGSRFERAEYLVKEQKKGEFNARMDTIAQSLANGQITWSQYNDARKETLTAHSAEKGILYDMKAILEKESVESIENWVKKNQKPEDKAMDEYKSIFYGDLPKDENGLTDWDAVYAEADAYLARQPKEIREYIEEHEHDWINNLPAMAQQIEKKRLQIIRLLRPYWEIEGGMYQQLAKTPGSQNIMAVKEEWDKMRASLPQQLINQGIQPGTPLWTRSIAIAKRQYAPRIILGGRVVAVDDLVSRYKEQWKRNPQNQEAVAALALWYAK